MAEVIEELEAWMALLFPKVSPDILSTGLGWETYQLSLELRRMEARAGDFAVHRYQIYSTVPATLHPGLVSLWLSPDFDPFIA